MAHDSLLGIPLNSRALMGVLGFACAVAWFLQTFFGASGFSLAAPASTHAALLCVGFAAIFVFSIALRSATPALIENASSPLLPSTVAVLGALLPLYLLAMPLETIESMGPSAICMLLVVAAFPAVALLLLWENYSGALGSNTARLFAAALCLGGLLHLLAVWAGDERSSWLFAIIYIAASSLSLFVLSNEVQKDKPAEELLLAPEIDRRITLLAFTLSIGFGMAWPVAHELTTPMVAFSAVAVLAFSLFANGPARLKDNTVIFLIRICLSCIVFGLLIGQIAGGRLAIVACFAIGAAWLVFWSLLDGLFIHRAQAAGMLPAVYLAPIKISGNAGFFLGWAYATAANWFFADTPYLPWLLIGLALVIVVLCTCLLPFGGANRREQVKTAVGAEKPLTMDEKMRRLSSIYSLTPREVEIVRFMAVGRNAGAIASKLVLSENTVRSHIYSIYNKLGVHSQQELIDLVSDSAFDPLSM